MHSRDPGAPDRLQVVLASLPFSSLYFANIGLGLLKAALERERIRCDVHHLHLGYAERVGIESYDLLTDSRYYDALLGEWIFAAAAHAQDPATGLDYCTDVLVREYPEQFPVSRLTQVLAARQDAAAFIESCLQSIDWS